VVFAVPRLKRLSVVGAEEFLKGSFANFRNGFEKWANTLPKKLASWAFAFDAILVSFTARQPPCLLILQIGILPKKGGRLPRFSTPPSEPNQKMGKLQPGG